MSAPRTKLPHDAARRLALALTASLAMFAAVASLLAADEEPAPPPPEVAPEALPVQIPLPAGQEPEPGPGESNGPAFDIVVPAPGDFGPALSEPDTNAEELNTPAGTPAAGARFPAASGVSPRPGGLPVPATAPGAPARRPFSSAPSGSVTTKADGVEQTNPPTQFQTNSPATTATNPPAATVDTHTEPEPPLGANASNRLDFSRFKLIADRNIFDPNRYPQMSRQPRRDTRRTPTVEAFSLVGIMIYSKGPFAFFDGSSSQYRKVLKPADKIAGYEITNVTPDKVQLVADGKSIDLKVGMQMRREDEGPWVLSGPAPVYASSPATTTEATAASNSSSTASNGGNDSEVLKRLLEKREKELSK